MIRVKVSEATGPVLDWMVSKAFGYNLKLRGWEDIIKRLDPVEDSDIIAFHKDRKTVRISVEQIPGGGWFPNPKYSTNWSQGGPIIEQEKLDVLYMGNGVDEHYWRAEAIGGFTFAKGLTPLIAAMRCFVASKLGDEVEVPEELLT